MGTGSPNIVVNNFKATGFSTVGILTSTAIGIGTVTAIADLHIFNSSATSQIYVGKQNSIPPLSAPSSMSIANALIPAAKVLSPALLLK